MDERRFRAVLIELEVTIKDFGEDEIFAALGVIADRFGYEFTKRDPGPITDDEDRFWDKVDTSGDCWVWTASTRGGYGKFWLDGDLHQAHRISYMWAGGTILDGEEVDHLCKNRACVRPDHLEAVSKLENNRRSESVSARKRRQTHCSRGHEFTPENTKVYVINGVDCRRCAICERINNKRRYDPSASCCDFGAFYEDQGIMAPLHNCPSPEPIEESDNDLVVRAFGLVK